MTTLYHFGGLCVHCGIPHDEVRVGPCRGDPAKAVPIAYRSMRVSPDGIERFLIRFSDGRVEQREFPVSQQAPYWHFGYSGWVSPIQTGGRIRLFPRCGVTRTSAELHCRGSCCARPRRARRAGRVGRARRARGASGHFMNDLVGLPHPKPP
jgi:hypothetical protein